MAFVAKNGQPSMEEILASIRRIVADDPSGVSPLIDLNRKSVDRTAASGTVDVDTDDSPDFELPSMFRLENSSDPRGQLSAKLNAKQKSAPIGRLTDAIRNVGPKRVVGTTRPRAQSQTSGKTVPQGVEVAQQEEAHQCQVTPHANGQSKSLDNGDAGFGIRPKAAQSLSSLANNGADTQSTTNGPVSSMQNGVHQSGLSVTNGHAEASAVTNGATSDLNAVQQTSQQPAMAGGADANEQPQAVQSPQVTTNNSGEAPPQSVAQAAAKTTAKSPPRVMAPFRDTRMQMMGPTAEAKAKQVKVPKSASEPVSEHHQTEPTQTVQPAANTVPNSDIGAIVPGALDLPGRGLDVATESITGSGANEGDDMTTHHRAVAAPQQMAEPTGEAGVSPEGLEAETNPPPLPEGSDNGASEQIEDATADLLRPMLRQWLSDNMPRMVEKALHIEVAETVRTGKPTDGS